MPKEIAQSDQGPIIENREGRVLWKDKLLVKEMSAEDLAKGPEERTEQALAEKVERQCVLRTATPEDFDGIMNVDRDRWRYRHKMYQIPLKTEPEPEYADEVSHHLEEPGESEYLVLTADNEVAGYIAFGKEAIDDDALRGQYELSDDGATKRIYTLSVIERYMKNGFAAKLLEHAIEEAEKRFGAKRIILSTQKENRDALRVYVKNIGFKKIGKLELDEKRQWSNCKDDPENPGKKLCYRVRLVLNIEKWKEKPKDKKE